ncbi:MAG: amino acid adenylation domain-containing protein, partial [Acidobacteriota bacterium]
VVVGVCLERCIEMVIAVLGILKAGGAYLPLDPNYPRERLAFMIEDANIAVLLTQERLMVQSTSVGVPLICLDKDWLLVAQQSCANLNSNVNSENLASVIYTSGSTGKPKGVMIQHRSVCNLAEAQVEAFEVKPDDRILQFASFSFDACLSEIIIAWHSGATIYLSTKGKLIGFELIELLRTQAITIVTLPPSVLANLESVELPGLHSLISAGEICSSELLMRWNKGRKFFNAYGPTEGTVCSTIYECKDTDSKPPIGRPIANVQIYILDQAIQQIPVGIPGELFIGGVGLARGYLNRADLTAEKFLPNPYSGEAGARLYRTGDLARYRADGNIEFIGRIDNQIKVRGFRIELGEVEAALSECAEVREAVVIVREDVPGDRRLVAYLVSIDGKAIATTLVREQLKHKLPEYMIPSAYVMMEKLPLTANGKLDRKTLPMPENLSSQVEAGYLPPRNDVEQRLVTIWQEVLKIRNIGICDNFFDLGGHSLLMAQVHDKIRKVFSTNISMIDLFKYPTISLLVKHLNLPQTERPAAALQGSTRAETRIESIKKHRQLRQSNIARKKL